MSLALTEDNQLLINKYKTAKAVWTQLKIKYKKTSELTTNTYMTSIQNFKYDKEKRINRYQAQLYEFHCKLYTANKNMKQTYSDSALLHILTNQLSKKYIAIRDTF